jgi:hypothetical protein
MRQAGEPVALRHDRVPEQLLAHKRCECHETPARLPGGRRRDAPTARASSGPSSLASGTTDGDDRTVGKSLLVAAATVVAAAVLLLGVRLLGATSAAFAFLVVWAPMTWLGTVSRFFQPRLPRRYHDLSDFERDPWLYELLGVRLVKRLLRRGPLAVFNPGLHLPAERSPERLAELEQRMKDAEASHFVLLVVMLGVVINAATRGWWVAAGLTLLFDVLMNGYPVMLQRYNRALLYARFPNHAGRRASTTPGLTAGPG